MKEHWHEAAFWRWWWRERVSGGTKVVATTLFVAALLSGGWIASSGLPGAHAEAASSSYVLETTVSRVVTVREHGKTIVKKVPVVIRRSVIRSRTDTVVETTVIRTPGGIRYVQKKVLVPVVRRRVVTVGGKTSTVTETRLVPTVKTQTLTNVVTNQQTVQQVVTNERTVERTATVVQPVTTVETRTVTLPPDTVTVTQTETVTRTETSPAVTVEVTVTFPSG
jgi:hypothetical protein